ncbi:MAG: response regulator [Candidatus Cloacimonetes bacterium]|nr:response regulator [Candidatus Cloacimonadota bacterium]
MQKNSDFQWDNEISLLLLSNKIATRSALESMLSFGSQKIQIQNVSNLTKLAKETSEKDFDIIILSISDLKDSEISAFCQDHLNLPVILVDNYYNRTKAENLIAAGALDYLDISTLDSRLLLKTINFSIQRKNAENQALQAQQRMKIRSTFLANMSHEIRTPLNSIIGFSELLYDEETDAVKREKLNMIRQSGKHLLTLINGILDFSKLEAGKIKADSEDFSIDDLVMTLYYMMLVKAGDRNLDLNVKPLGKIPELVKGDKFRINQVLINLMNNAIKFTETGSVTLEYSYNDNMAVFNVIDTGIGIPLHQQNHIFDAFEQLYQLDNSQQQGTGLGLAISRNLVHLMNGSISVNSEPGKGASFKVSIPLPVTKWQSESSLSRKNNKYPARKLGVIYLNSGQKKAFQLWGENNRIEILPVSPDNWQEDGFLMADIILIPQEMDKNQKTEFSEFLKLDFRTRFKPKVFYLLKNNRIFFFINKKLINAIFFQPQQKFLDHNLKPDDFLDFINYFFENIEAKGKEMIKIWKKNFKLENPGLEDVLFEAILRMHDRVIQLNMAAAAGQHQLIQEIAHSLKGFTGQTCIYEISNKASLILDEIRSNKQNHNSEAILPELAEINEILYLLPRKFIGIAPAYSPASSPEAPPVFPPMNILVAEDNSINQAVIKDFLLHFNLKCTLASNGQEALDLMTTDKYDLLFLDIQMPVLNGIETLKHIRNNPDLADIFVVALTAYVFEESDDEFLHHNCDAYLTKPFEKKNLLEVLQKAADVFRQKK